MKNIKNSELNAIFGGNQPTNCQWVVGPIGAVGGTVAGFSAYAAVAISALAEAIRQPAKKQDDYLSRNMPSLPAYMTAGSTIGTASSIAICNYVVGK